MRIYFDMDGTIADLYGVNNWLDDLRSFKPRPYEQAKPLLNMQALARVLNRLIRQGHEVSIISWLSKESNSEYDAVVTQAKLKWLDKHLHSVRFTEIHIVKYGTPKQSLGSGILFDDEENNRINWCGDAYDVNNIIKVLRGL